MPSRRFLSGVLTLIALTGCDIYTSSDRKKFEEDHMQAASLISAQVKSPLTLTSCSSTGLAHSAELSRDVMTFTDHQQIHLLRQHLIQNEWVYETDNMNGVYCLYENSTD